MPREKGITRHALDSCFCACCYPETAAHFRATCTSPRRRAGSASAKKVTRHGSAREGGTTSARGFRLWSVESLSDGTRGHFPCQPCKSREHFCSKPRWMGHKIRQGG